VVTLDLSSDDAEQENDEVDTPYDDDLDAGWEGEPADQNILTLGLRFRDLYLLPGSTIDSAFIRFHAHESKTAADVAQLTIVGEATDNAVTFDSANFNANYLLTDRPETQAKVQWTVDKDWTIWQPYKTSDIGPIVQELVNRSGWQSGNAMAFILKGEDQGPSTVENAREMTAFENIADPDDFDPQGNPGDGRNHPEWVPELIVYVNGPLSQTERRIIKADIFPNPAEGKYLKVSLSQQGRTELILTDLMGNIVRRKKLDRKQEAQLPVEDLSRGTYLLKVSQKGSTFTQKVILK
jgi:hypothetical protein